MNRKYEPKNSKASELLRKFKKISILWLFLALQN